MREEYRKWAGMVTRNKYSEFTTSTSGSNHNQTRVRANAEVGVLDQKEAGRGLVLTGVLSL